MQAGASMLKAWAVRPTMRDVEQISLPMRIALGVVLAFAALWFVALRPKPVTELAAEPEPAPVTRAAPAKDAAAGPAAKKAEPRPAVVQAKPEPKPAPAKELKGGERVLADLDAGRAVVLLFWNRTGEDDRAVRRAVSGIDRRDGKVRVHVAELSRLSDYEQLTRGVPVTTSPTVLVIDRQKRARTIRGLTVTAELDDAVARAVAGK